MRITSAVLFSVIALTLPARAGEFAMTKAQQEFAAGNYKAAIADYKTEVAAGRWSANLFYDLGNGYFRQGDLGRAILNYERALQIDPRHPEAQANLRMARAQTRGLELTPSPLEKFATGIRPSSWVLAAAILFWLAIFLLLAKRRGVFMAAATMCLIASAASAWIAWSLENGRRGRGAAIVVGENVEARVATADTARSLLALPSGSEVVILQKRGDWNYAVLPNGQRGWIGANAAEAVRLDR